MSSQVTVRTPSLASMGRGKRRAAGSKRSFSSYRSRSYRRIPRGVSSSTRRHCYTRVISTGATPGTSDAISVNSLASIGCGVAGVNSGNFDLQFSFSLQKVQMYIAGATWYNWDMPSYTDFTNLYDKYRIDWIDVSMTFNSNTSTPAGGGVTTMPKVFVAEDNDDVSASNLAVIQQYDNLKIFQFGAGDGVMKTFRIHPKCQEMVYYTAALTGYQPSSSKKFIDTQYPNIPMYGLKAVIDPIVYTAATQPLGYISMSFKYHITCESTK